MAIATRAAHLPALGVHERDEVGRELQATLLELVDLSLLGKQLHWSVVGPQFRPLHLYLDELIDSWRELADTTAERAVALGVWPDGQAGAVAAGSGIASIEPGPLEDVHLLRELVKRVAEVAERARGRMDRLAEVDSASEDVLVEVVRALEEQLWMIRSQLPLEGGRSPA
jgi:starvation-inducible DNA-binding protein